MSNITKNAGASGYPYSGQIIGAVVMALDLDRSVPEAHYDYRSVLKGRTAQRYFAGSSVNEHNHQGIFEALGEALVARGIVPIPPLFRQYNASTAVIIGMAIARAALRWDNLLATVQSHSPTIVDRGLAVDRILRLVVVDLALRVFAFLRLAGMEPPRPETPLWAQKNGGGELLRALVKSAGLTRNQLALRLSVSYTAVDNWLDGKNRPSAKNIAALAKALAGRVRDERAERLEQEIQRQFTLAQLADKVEPDIGRERIVDLSTALVRFVWLISEDVRAMDRRPIEETAGAEFDALWFGTADPSTHILLRNMAQSEADVRWRRDILAATGDWKFLFQVVANQTSGDRFAAGLAQDAADVWNGRPARSGLDEPPGAGDTAQEALKQLGTETDDVEFDQGGVRKLGQLLEAGIACRRAIVRDYPLSANAHYQLGSFLGMAGKWLVRRDLVDEGITECKIAAGLLPDWDAPAVEPGIILANIGSFEEALRELGQARSELPKATPHLMFVNGYVSMMLSSYEEALEHFEKVIAVRPDYALASLYAARSAFRLGDKRKGLRYAKAARRFGDPGEYIAWSNGAYSSRNKRKAEG